MNLHLIQKRVLASIVGGFPKWFLNNIEGIKFLSALQKFVTGKTFSQTINLFGSLSGTFKWWGGVLAPNGKIYGIPYNSTQILEIDPEIGTTTLFGSLGTGPKWVGGVLAPNGKIYGIPYNSTQILEIGLPQEIPADMVLSRYLNKF